VEELCFVLMGYSIDNVSYFHEDDLFKSIFVRKPHHVKVNLHVYGLVWREMCVGTYTFEW
jgi:hypothetical protein